MNAKEFGGLHVNTGYKTNRFCNQDVTDLSETQHFIQEKDGDPIEEECTGQKKYNFEGNESQTVADILKESTIKVDQSPAAKLKDHLHKERISHIYWLGKTMTGGSVRYQYLLVQSGSVFKPLFGKEARYPLSSNDMDLILEEFLAGEPYDFHPGEIMKDFFIKNKITYGNTIASKRVAGSQEK